ncbi:MAG: pentapeptide repeat-containing protein [Planctomycetes bacterium]|nr:pentapeptide repeat-containing protein [Planctomycetota bacterium]
MKLHKTRERIEAENANLADSSFDDVNLRGASFTNVNLSAVRLENVNLSGATIRQANLSGMRIEGVLVSELLAAYRSQAGAVLFAKDLERVRSFYREVFGLETSSAEATHLVLRARGIRFVVHAIPEPIRASIQIENPPQRRSESALKLVFEVESLARARELARERGGELLPADHEWEDAGQPLCDGVDPEGNVFQCCERGKSGADCHPHAAHPA